MGIRYSLRHNEATARPHRRHLQDAGTGTSSNQELLETTNDKTLPLLVCQYQLLQVHTVGNIS
jgi:hypothetical protein